MPKNYVSIWEQFNHEKLSKNKEIHHIDGNHRNNDPGNLLAVTIKEHLAIHEKQKDWDACQAILIRMNRTKKTVKKIRLAASNFQKELWENNNHNFQKISKKERTRISREVGKRTAREKIGIHAINADPVLAKENARKAGLVAAKRKAGFLNTDSEKHGSKFVKNTLWWYNINTRERKRSTKCPGPNWKHGMNETAFVWYHTRNQVKSVLKKLI